MLDDNSDAKIIIATDPPIFFKRMKRECDV